MFCPHCNSSIPDGSNICPLCYGNIAGVRTQPAQEQVHPDADEPQVKQPPKKKKSGSGKKPAYTKGSRGAKKNPDKAPMIIAIGLILILVIIIAMIIMSMFGAGDNKNVNANPGANTSQAAVKQTPDTNLIVFGATATPQPYVQVTATPRIEVTPTPTPVPAVSYSTLRKGDEGPDVVTMQLALTELGYLSGAADGNFGTGTQTAVKNFQKDKGLDADGIAGKMTLEALYKASSVTPMPDSTPAVQPGDILDLPG